MITLRQGRQAGLLAAWGLGRDGDGWWQEAACVETPELHTADLRAGWQSTGSVQAMARHICLSHCPVVEQCQAEARRKPPREVVQGGAVWVQGSNTATSRIASIQPPDTGCGPWCAHLRGRDVAA